MGLKPPTDYNFMLLGIDFDFFLVTFECNVRFQKFKSLNRSKFNPKSESLIKIHVSPPLEQGLPTPLGGTLNKRRGQRIFIKSEGDIKNFYQILKRIGSDLRLPAITRSTLADKSRHSNKLSIHERI